MLTYFRDPTYELALSSGVLYSYVTYLAYVYGCSQRIIYHTLSLALSSVWLHTTKTELSFWVDQVVLNTWVPMFVYEAYLRHWMAVAMSMLCILYAILMFYVGQAKRTFAYHPSRAVFIFFHMSVHLFSAMTAIYIVTMFPVPK